MNISRPVWVFANLGGVLCRGLKSNLPALVLSLVCVSLATPAQGQAPLWNQYRKSIQGGVRHSVARPDQGRDAGKARAQRPAVFGQSVPGVVAARIAARLKSQGKEYRRIKIQNLGSATFVAYVPSHIHPGGWDSFSLFKRDRSGHVRELSARSAVLDKFLGSATTANLIQAWRDTVAKVLSPAYKRFSTSRLHVDWELKLLEKEIAQRQRKKDATVQVPWNEKLDTQPQRSVFKPWRRNWQRALARILSQGTLTGPNAMSALNREAVILFPLTNLPRRAFKRILDFYRGAGRKPQGIWAKTKASDQRALKRSDSALRRALGDDLMGFEFPALRGAWVNERGITQVETARTIVHEINHVANRVPQKRRYTAKEELASELTAFDAESRFAGNYRNRSDWQALKRTIIKLYSEKGVSADSVPDVPQGNRDNWIPRFPKGQEAKYLEAWFEAPQP